MQLLRSLLLSAARHSFSFSARHVPGVNNQIADALSRFRWQDFRQILMHSLILRGSPQNFWQL